MSAKCILASGICLTILTDLSFEQISANPPNIKSAKILVHTSKPRGITKKDLTGKPAEFALPNVLVRLSIESDRMFTY